MGKNTPFSPRLRQLSIRATGHIWRGGVKLETIHILNRLEVGVDDAENKGEWVEMLRDVIRSPQGLKTLSSHYWLLLDRLLSTADLEASFTSEDKEVMRLLEEAGEWEKLEVWMVLVWQTLPAPGRYRSASDLTEGPRQSTLKLLLQRPSALQRIEDLCKTRTDKWAHKDTLQEICNRAKGGNLSP